MLDQHKHINATQAPADVHTHSQGLQGTNEKGNGYISGWLPRLWFQGGVCPCAPCSAVHCWLLPGHSKLYHLLSLAKRRLRIWKAVTKFIWEEWEQIAWSRCYKRDKAKVAQLRGLASVRRIGECFYSAYICEAQMFWSPPSLCWKENNTKEKNKPGAGSPCKAAEKCKYCL